MKSLNVKGKSMNRKTKIGIAIVTAIAVLGLVAFASTPENQGYALFKELLKSNAHQNFESGDFDGRVSGTVTVTDNGKQLVSVVGDMAVSEADKGFQGNVTLQLDNLNKDLAIYGNHKQVYILDKAANQVYVGDHQSHMAGDDEAVEGMGHSRDMDRDFINMSAQEEAVMDFFVGDLAKQFEVVPQSDGSQDLAFELTKAEMPAIINLITSLKPEGQGHNYSGNGHFGDDENMGTQMDLSKYPLFQQLDQAKVQMPELVEQVSVNHIKALMDLDAKGQVDGIAFSLEISGLDKDGVAHNVSVNADLDVSKEAVGNIEKIDLTGKTIFQLPEHEMNAPK